MTADKNMKGVVREVSVAGKKLEHIPVFKYFGFALRESGRDGEEC